MSLRVAVGAPFLQKGKEEIGEQEFVVALSLDRDWMSPDQAKKLLDVGAREGLLRRENGRVAATFDASDVEIPEEFTVDDSLFRERSAFERVLDDLVAEGHDRQETVAAINDLQGNLGVTADAAAVVYARRHGLAADDAARVARDALEEEA
ncbi:DUF2240 family protein [Halocalculus aciditolerans]|uniref:DUF2240 family protein n=1 Tax=Halocalculus aciditolerans TaxID=1383812 RepID=A0A830FII2_9EURY|nr:DUF2240 family protein [Halocalculus aciditolerans]GGL50541.1 hypothetical protein GCM10009039_05930 [Halocalculus aciditolerans]